MFFFQAEDGIRDIGVTGVQTCALPICDDVEALAAGPDGSIWASTSIGVHRIDGEHRDLYLKGTRISGLHVDRTNRVWVGTDRGIARMQGGQWRYLTPPDEMQLKAVTAITGA